MVGLFEKVADEIARRIRMDVKKGLNIDIILNAYNYWRENEFDGSSYIFDIENKDDFKFVVNEDIVTPSNIAWITGHETSLFYIDDDGAIKMVYRYDLCERLETYIPHIVRCMILYVGRCGDDSPYCDLYEKYVVNCLEGSTFTEV